MCAQHPPHAHRLLLRSGALWPQRSRCRSLPDTRARERSRRTCSVCTGPAHVSCCLRSTLKRGMLSAVARGRSGRSVGWLALAPLCGHRGKLSKGVTRCCAWAASARASGAPHACSQNSNTARLCICMAAGAPGWLWRESTADRHMHHTSFAPAHASRPQSSCGVPGISPTHWLHTRL